MTTTTFILLLNACEKLATALLQLYLVIHDAVAIARWRKRLLRRLHRRGGG